MFEETLDEKKEKIYQYNIRFNVNKSYQSSNKIVDRDRIDSSIKSRSSLRGWSFFFWSREIYEKFAVNILSDNSMARHDQAKQQRSRFETLLEGRNSVSFEFSSWRGAATHAA